MVALSVPMFLFYELSIVIGRFIDRAATARPTRPTDRPDASDFALDPFQVEAIAALDRGESVLVAAPTGSGKTVVAEHAVERALAESAGRVFYTTPIKALSNQKYGDLVRRHGADDVGLLTGDNAINGERPGRGHDHRGPPQHDLRGLAAARRPALRRPRRGPLPPGRLPRAGVGGGHHPRAPARAPGVPVGHRVERRRAGRLDRPTVRGPTATVVERTARSSWSNLYLVADGIERRAAPHPHARRRPAQPRGAGRSTSQRDPGRGTGGPQAPPLVHAPPGRRGRAPRATSRCCRPSTSSSAGPPATTPPATCVDAGPPADDRRGAATASAIIAERHVRDLSDATSTCLGYDRWLAGLEAGIAAHHAGMVPPFKEAVEACFVEGLVKVVFATETLALGINMPARSVVIEKLTKFTGERHEFLTPAQYTQLTGRAGRRGIDDHRHTPSCCGRRSCPSTEVAALAASRRFELRSAFRPTYNMAANLVRRYDRTTPTACSTCRSPSSRPTGRSSGSSAARRTAPGAGRGRGGGRVRAGRRRRVPGRCSTPSQAKPTGAPSSGSSRTPCSAR